MASMVTVRNHNNVLKCLTMAEEVLVEAEVMNKADPLNPRATIQLPAVMNPAVGAVEAETAVVFQDHRVVHQVVAFQDPLVAVQDLPVAVVAMAVAADWDHDPIEVNKINSVFYL